MTTDQSGATRSNGTPKPARSVFLPEGQDTDQEGLDLRARLRVIRRRFFYFSTCLVLSLLIGGVVSVRAPRIYKASATIFIDANAPEVLAGVRDVVDLGVGYWASKEYYETQYGVIRSRLVAQKVATRLGLVPSVLIEEVEASPAGSMEFRISGEGTGGLSESLTSKLKILGLAKLKTREETIERLKKLDTATLIQKRISVEAVRDSRIVGIAVEDEDKDLAALIANAVVDAYIEVNLDQKVDATRSAVNWLTGQMEELKVKVTQSEAALHEFREKNHIDSVSMEEKQAIYVQKLSLLNQSLSSTRASGFALGSRRSAIRSALAAGTSLDGFSEVATNAYVQKLKGMLSDARQDEANLLQRYTSDHPSVVAAHHRVTRTQLEYDGEVSKVIAALEREYEMSMDTQKRLSDEISRVNGEALSLGQKELDYGRLKRDRDNNLALYDVILKREKEANLTQMLKVNNVRKLDMARPPLRPIRPNVKMNMLAALLVGLVASIAVAFLVDYLDNSVKSQDQIEKIIGLPFLGLVPTIKLNGSKRNIELSERDLHVVKHPRSVVAEAWRTVRTNIMFMSPDNPARTMLISSSGPREGKSTTVINMSITMALLGARTLVVDTDMRRPRLHKSFGMTNDVGLSNVILGDVEVEEAIRPTSLERLDILTCGPIPPNPAELLHTVAFRNIFAALARDYDRVIFDSPPIGAVTDALVLASMVDGVVLVVEAGRSSWQATVRSKRRIQDVGGGLYGVVLNNVDLDKRTDTEYYYYRNYRYGYAVEDKKV